MTDFKKFSQSDNVWDKVSEHFSVSGPHYWQWFGATLVEAANIKENETVLDIGFGRGASLFPALKAVGKGGKVIGLEASEGMVYHTNKILEERHINNGLLHHVQLGNYRHSHQYDHIINGFGLGFMIQDNQLDLLHGQLKKDGKLSFVTWTHQHDQDWLTGLVNKHLNITETHDRSPLTTLEGLKEHLKNSNFSSVDLKLVTHDVLFVNEAAWFEDMMNCAVRNIIDAISESGDTALKAFKEEAFEGLQQFKTRDGFLFKREAILAICHK